MVMTFPANGPIFIDELISSTIFSGSTILPGPISPHACSPSAGPIIDIDLEDNFLQFSCVL